MAVRLWGSRWAGLRIQVFCDNESVVAVINSGITKDLKMGKILRNAWLAISTYEFELRAVHLSEASNRHADLLSRWHLDPVRSARSFADEMGPVSSIVTDLVSEDLFLLDSDL